MAKLKQVLLLTWKNFKLQIRHPWITILELGLPTIFALCVLFVRTAIQSGYVSEPVIYEPYSISSLPQNLTPRYRYQDWQVLYAPNSEFLSEVMSDIAEKLGAVSIGFQDEDILLKHYENYTAQVLSGVVFDKKLENGTANVTNFVYTIRPKNIFGTSSDIENMLNNWYTEYTFPLLPALGLRGKNSNWGATPDYMAEGFLTLQHAVASSLMQRMNIDLNETAEKILNVKMCRYPYPPYLDDKFIVALQFFFPIILCFSFIYPAVNIVKSLVLEKEKRLKEAMKMMGLSKWLLWMSWFLKHLIFLSASCAIIIFLLCVKFKNNLAVINSSDPSVIFIFLLCYTMSVISFCFLLSTLFSSASSSVTGGGILFYVTFVPYYYVSSHYNDLSAMTKFLLCLSPNSAVALGAIILAMAEASGAGLQWENITKPVNPDDTLTMSLILIMFLLDGIIYLILTWYIEAVCPGKYGVPEPWYFPFTRSYWFGRKPNLCGTTQLFHQNDRSEFFERDPSNIPVGIQVKNLAKMYDKGTRPAVNNLSINMYKNQIFVLLGHNGAGKTTTISMLTGLITPSSGTAVVNGFDICKDMNRVHSNLGICPQYNVLFDELTVEEHLYFFCKLKGYVSDLVQAEIEHIIRILNLEEYRNVIAQALSGGWKRKLSVGIALIADSKVVILDEPTSGMDPFNRRSLWDALQNEKKNRTVLLTTHFMEEADVLGDRIAIMANGEVQCCGSPLFLKKKYGAGYHLVMVKEPSCDVSLITEVVQSHVPNVEMASNIGKELKYILPHESRSLFYGLFSKLEANKNELKISSYGASITTMEEVFIRVENTAANQDSVRINMNKGSVSSSRDSGIHLNPGYNDDIGETDNEDKSTESPYQRRNGNFSGNVNANSKDQRRTSAAFLFFQQFYALSVKCVLYSYRKFMQTLSPLVLPSLLLIMILCILKVVPKPGDSPPLQLDVESFHGTEIPYVVNMNSKESVILGKLYASQFSDRDDVVLLESDKQNWTSYLIEKAKSDIGKYNMHNMIGALFVDEKQPNETSAIALFNNQALHSPAIALFYVHNTILKYFRNESYSFSVTNHPLPRTVSGKGKQQRIQYVESYQISQIIIVGLSFLLASFSVLIIEERLSNFKLIQKICGVNSFSYWFSLFLWNYLNYLLCCCLLAIVFVCFSTEGLSSSAELGRLFLLFALHGFSHFPLIYCCSFLFRSPSSAYIRLTIWNVIIAVACLMTVTIVEVPALGVEYVAKPLDYVLSALVPSYALGRSINSLYQNHQFNKFCNTRLIKLVCKLHLIPSFDAVKPCCKGECGDDCIPWKENYLSTESPGIGYQLICFVVQSVVYVCLLILCEKNILQRLKYKINGHSKNEKKISTVVESVLIANAVEDDDVVSEKLKILNTPLKDLFSNNHLIAKEITKYYGSLLAVDKLTFGVQKGECFGLLGLNGAGKTTTFKMITGDESISSGEIYVNGYSIKKEPKKVQSQIGYCPQFDALIDQLTGAETLTFFARLRGIPESLIPDQITYLSELLDFNQHVNKQVKCYSGGNKRKLSVAVALIGDPTLVFLDEPTTGMDPVSRRHMWRALLQVLQSGRSAVLTSHSMEECEALCNRIGIMVNGKLCCLGSPQHLKNKFAQGFTLIIKTGMKPLPKYSQMESTFSLEESKIQSPQRRSSVPRRKSSASSWSTSALLNDMHDVKTFVEKTFASAILKSSYENFLHYHIPNPELNWSEIFKAMEEAKARLNIEDYSVGETTLEQVFLNFTMAQREAGNASE